MMMNLGFYHRLNWSRQYRQIYQIKTPTRKMIKTEDSWETMMMKYAWRTSSVVAVG